MHVLLELESVGDQSIATLANTAHELPCGHHEERWLAFYIMTTLRGRLSIEVEEVLEVIIVQCVKERGVPASCDSGALNASNIASHLELVAIVGVVEQSESIS